MDKQISELRQINQQSTEIIEEILESNSRKCNDGLLDVLEAVLENCHAFDSTETVLNVIKEITGSSRKAEKRKTKKGDKLDKEAN